MEFLQLHYFQVVARHEHMTRAARELNVSQPSLSNSIQRLEQQLGLPLFVRHGRQIRLNSFGKAFLQRVDRAFLELDEGRREIQDMAGLDRGVVSLAITLPNILPVLLRDFLKLRPDVRIMQRQAISPFEMRNDLESGETDFCISTRPVTGPDIEWLSLVDEEIFLSVPNGHRLAGRGSIRLIEAKDEPFIAMGSGYSFRQITDEFCRAAGFEPQIAFELEEIGAVQTLVELGLGVTFTPVLTLKGFHRPASVPLRIREPDCRRTIGLAWHKRRFISRAAVDFRKFAVDFFKQAGANP
ncbi:LysR family transcriptional regulator [Paenibacillus piri]|uniref:LysR family transcriptional regulator n=1 Tax=Paenibacillus piri TaxID=2547395 RepID=A0A4R5KIV9_9BACL|nr:LysR family transcriptional regulator [Paenibacillus piri]TDF95052.1 LysR family transcriptional regulator [Paenibacillus piri]